jgi:hypothetical protein
VNQRIISIEILEDNDSVPEEVFTSSSKMIPEDSALQTVIALFKTQDSDSRENREAMCLLQENTPFRTSCSSSNYYRFVTDGNLDQKQSPEYPYCHSQGQGQAPPPPAQTLPYTSVTSATVPPSWSLWLRITLLELPSLKLVPLNLTWLPTAHNLSFLESNLEPRAAVCYMSVSVHSRVLLTQCTFDCDLSANVSLHVLWATTKTTGQGCCILDWGRLRATGHQSGGSEPPWDTIPARPRGSDTGLFSLGLHIVRRTWRAPWVTRSWTACTFWMLCVMVDRHLLGHQHTTPGLDCQPTGALPDLREHSKVIL